MPAAAVLLAATAVMLALARSGAPPRSIGGSGPDRSSWSGGRLWQWVGGALVGAACLAALGVLPTAAIATGWWAWPRWRRLRAGRESAASVQRDWPDVIELLAVFVASGATPSHALRLAGEATGGPLGTVLGDVRTRIERGQRFADAVGLLRLRVGLDAAPVVDLLVSAHRDGLPVGPLLDRLCEHAREQRRRHAAAAARRLPVRLAAPLVLCTLPGFVLLAVVPLVAGALSSLSLP